MRRPSGPLAPEVLEDLERRLVTLDRGMDAERAALRLLVIAETLATGRPEPELFELAAAVALHGRHQCLLRDRDRPNVAAVK